MSYTAKAMAKAKGENLTGLEYLNIYQAAVLSGLSASFLRKVFADAEIEKHAGSRVFYKRADVVRVLDAMGGEGND